MDTYYDWVNDPDKNLEMREREILMRHYRKIYSDKSHIPKLKELLISTEKEFNEIRKKSRIIEADYYAYHATSRLCEAIYRLKADLETDYFIFWEDARLAEAYYEANEKKKIEPIINLIFQN